MSPSEKPTIYNALGVFGRLDAELEDYFLATQTEYYSLSKEADEFGVFPHLTLVVDYNVQADQLRIYENILRALKTFLPFVLKTNGLRIIDDRNIAFSFNINQTQQLRDIAHQYLPTKVIDTDYFTVMRLVPKDLQEVILGKLNHLKSLTFTDFVLSANKVDDQHILALSSGN